MQLEKFNWYSSYGSLVQGEIWARDLAGKTTNMQLVIESMDVDEISQGECAECNKNETWGRTLKHQHLKGKQWNSNSRSPKRAHECGAIEAERTMKWYVYISQMQRVKERKYQQCQMLQRGKVTWGLKTIFTRFDN